VFMLCPVSILITGYHSQFDNVALLLALLSWRRLAGAGDTLGALERRSLVIASLLMGASLATKHVVIFFPLWVLVWPGRPLRQRLAYCALAYVVFAGAFIPFALTPEAWSSINKNVLHYRSWYGNGLLPRLSDVFAQRGTVEGSFRWMPVFPGLQFVWLMAMLMTGVVVARKFPRQLFFVYPVAMLAYAPAMAEQYLAIPLVSCAYYWRRWAVWAYIATATALLTVSGVNIGALQSVRAHTAPLRALGIAFPHAQLWLLLLLLSFFYLPRDRTNGGAR